MKRQPATITTSMVAGLGLIAGAVIIAIGLINFVKEERVSERVRIALGMIIAALIGITMLILLRMSDTGI